MNQRATSLSLPSCATPGLVAESMTMREVLAAADDVAPTHTTVLLFGESGTGKEMVARYIHQKSTRAHSPYVAVNCAAIPQSLLENELFGHERGSFTGASERYVGKIEQANHGTLLLDEISELPLSMQAKLLRVLQERELDRIGGSKSIPVDIRVVATSNRDLREMVQQQQFRADLYYRLNVFVVSIAPLRERPDDIQPLANHLLRTLAAAHGRAPLNLTPTALEWLKRYNYPGNVRELQNILERAVVRAKGPVVSAEEMGLHLPHSALMHTARNSDGEKNAFPADLPLDLTTLERIAIFEALRRADNNRTRAAQVLGIGLRTLRNKLRTYRTEGRAV